MALLKPVVGRSIIRRFKGGSGTKLPVIAGHKLLYSCNLKCKMCPFWRRDDEDLLSFEYEVKIMNSLKSAGVSFMGYEGGEPLLRGDIGQILEESYRRFHTSMVTNGWLLKTKLKDIEENLNYMFVSLDGIGDVHDKLRGVSGSFRKAVDGIEAARERIPMSISSTITKENMDQAEALVRLAVKLGVSINFQIAYDYSTAEQMSPEQNQLRKTIELLRNFKDAGYPILNTREYFDAIINSWFEGQKWKCKPWLTINVDPTGGVVQPCYVLNEYNGSVKVWDVDIRKLWNSTNWEVYESCNKCALACYLEPSLFSWHKFSMIRERILDNMVGMIQEM
jgi:radical SAM family uncharacterized protein